MHLPVQEWLKLSPIMRKNLAKVFRITPSGFTHVVDNKVETDGFTYKDLEGINLQAMKEITHLESDSFEEQFKLVLKMLDPDIELTLQNNDPTTQRTNPGTVSGTNPQTEESQGGAVSLPGSEQQVSPGRSELLPSSADSNTASMEPKNAEVNPGQPKARRNAGKGRGRV